MKVYCSRYRSGMKIKSSLVPKGDQNLGESGYCEIVFRLLNIRHQALCSERYPDPTTNCEVESATSIGRSTYFVDFAPVFFIYFCTRDTGEASKKPFSNGVDRIGRGFGHDPAAARSD